MAATVVSIINLKGGVGKSTLTMILGEFLAFALGKRVLLIDMDAQGNLSYCMAPEASINQQEKQARTAYHLLKAYLNGKKADIRDFITQPPLVVSNIARSSATRYPGLLHMVVSTPTMAQLDDDLLKLWEDDKPFPEGLRQSLAEALSPARDDYDYVLIDCPPGLSLFSSTALVASHYFVSPIVPEPLSLQGVELVKRRAGELNEKYKAHVQFKGVILNIVKYYRVTHKRVSEMLYTAAARLYQPFDYWLPDNERLRRLGEFDTDLPGTWGGRVGQKFGSLNDKYSLPYLLTNPEAGPLSRKGVEGPKYKLYQRIEHLVNEFIGRCET